MDNSYIFHLEENLKYTLNQFRNALEADRKDLDIYRDSNYKRARTVERWENKITAYTDAFNELEFLLNRSVVIDHERSTYVHQINKLRDDNKRLKKYLNILSVTKKIEIEEQVKFKTEQRVNQLCKQAEHELKNEIDLIKQVSFMNNQALERRVA
ncbi:hypothetical protein GCM10027443_29920 [Pontibacter brevis]